MSLLKILAPVLMICPTLPAAVAASPQHIAPDAKVFLEPMSGFETDLAAAIVKKHVPIVIVADEKNAAYLVSGGNQDVKAGWAKTVFFTPAPSEHASITVKDSASGEIVYAYAWDKLAARKGSQSAAEGIAKHLKAFIEKK